jgi:hypothetical protein
VHEAITVRTDFRVRRWDAGQVDWTLGQMGVPGRWHQKPNLAIRPEAFARHGVAPYSDTLDRDCNLITQAGWVALLGGIAGTTVTNKLSATHARIGVGTISTAAAYTDTALGGDTGGSSTTSYYMLVSGAPVVSTAVTPPTITLAATFGTTVANFPWNEFGADNYTASGVTATGLGAGFILFNHGISAQSTKVSGQVWTATVTFSFGYNAALT